MALYNFKNSSSTSEIERLWWWYQKSWSRLVNSQNRESGNSKFKLETNLLDDSKLDVLLRGLLEDIVGLLQGHVAGVIIVDGDNRVAKFKASILRATSFFHLNNESLNQTTFNELFFDLSRRKFFPAVAEALGVTLSHSRLSSAANRIHSWAPLSYRTELRSFIMRLKINCLRPSERTPWTTMKIRLNFKIQFSTGEKFSPLLSRERLFSGKNFSVSAFFYFSCRIICHKNFPM